MVERLVQAVGPKVMKLLIMERGFIDGSNVRRCNQQWAMDVLMPIKCNMDISANTWVLGQREPWQKVPVPAPPTKAAVVGRPESIVRREAKRQAKLAQRRLAPGPAQVPSRHKYC